jgi:hypothetical protein
VNPAENQIIELSAKVIALRDSDDFEFALEQLRNAIHLHLSRSRDKVADLAFLIANESGSKAAD